MTTDQNWKLKVNGQNVPFVIIIMILQLINLMLPIGPIPFEFLAWKQKSTYFWQHIFIIFADVVILQNINLFYLWFTKKFPNHPEDHYWYNFYLLLKEAELTE